MGHELDTVGQELLNGSAYSVIVYNKTKKP